MSPFGAVQIEPNVAALVLRRWYEVSLKPSVVHEMWYDRRAELIMGVVKLLQGEEFARLLPDFVEEIVSDVTRLMPTPEQIAGCRLNSAERFTKLKSHIFEPIPLASV